jgi:hypothetical protein
MKRRQSQWGSQTLLETPVTFYWLEPSWVATPHAEEAKGVVTLRAAFLLVKQFYYQRSDASWVLVAHACNPSYSEGRDQEDCSSKPAWANIVPQDPISKKSFTKEGWWSGSRCRP